MIHRPLFAGWPLLISPVLFVLATSLGSFAQSNPLPSADPTAVGINPDGLSRIDGLVAENIEAKNIPGCVVLVSRHGKQVFHRAYGHRQLNPEPLKMKRDTVFDMASLTKPVATATSILQLAEQGKLRLNDRYGLHVPQFNQNGKEDVTILQMLTHQAGLIPDTPLREYAVQEDIWPKLWAVGLAQPPASKFVYSDVGFQFLGRLVEVVSGQRLQDYTRDHIFQPLGMMETGYLPSPNLRTRAATTEQRDGGWMQGEVHDPRAHAMGGVAGHAGLFSTAIDLSRYAQMVLNKGVLDGKRILSSRTVHCMQRHYDIHGDVRALGWDVQSRYSTNRGDFLSRKAIGHSGFTGTAMWIDPLLDLAVIVLSNRVHPDGQGNSNRLAGAIMNVVASSIDDRHPRDFDNHE